MYSESLKMVGEVKPFSLYGLSSGLVQMSRYTALSGCQPGGPFLMGSGVGVVLTGLLNRYMFFNSRPDMIGYLTLDPSHWEEKIAVQAAALRRPFVDQAALTVILPERSPQGAPN